MGRRLGPGGYGKRFLHRDHRNHPKQNKSVEAPRMSYPGGVGIVAEYSEGWHLGAIVCGTRQLYMAPCPP